MIKVTCPDNNIPERTYAIDIVFNRLFGLERRDNVDGLSFSQDHVYSIEYSQNEESYIVQNEKAKLIVHDHFWNEHQEPLSYLKEDSLPGKLSFLHAFGQEIPIVYGEDLLVQDEDSIVLGLDIFASVFFMLTRWEEILLGREAKGDCDEYQLWSVKNDIYKRPIVHEYEMLLRRLLSMEDEGKKRKYQAVMTHDVDGIITPSFSDIIKTGIRDKLHGRPKNKVLNLSWRQKLEYKRVFPHTTSQFDFYTALCSKNNIPEWFFMKVCKSGEVEATYGHDDKQVTNLMSYLRQNFPHSVRIGFHPSQTTFNNERQWDKESERIKNLLREKPLIGRNHHLLYNCDTYRKWDLLLTDSESFVSNCVFHKHVGFRSGIAVPYPIFDVYERQQLRTCEVPCQIMDTALRQHRYPSDEDMMKDVAAIVDNVKKYSGTLLLTWHIYLRDVKLLRDYFEICRKTVEYAAK